MRSATATNNLRLSSLEAWFLSEARFFCIEPIGQYTLKPGQYDVVVKSTGNQRVHPFKGSWSIDNGTTYSNCFYIVTNPVERASGEANPNP